MKSVRLTMAVCTVMIGAQASAGPAMDWLNKQVFNRVDVVGRRTLGYHSHTVDGSSDSFRTLTYGGQGGDAFTDRGNINLSGRDVFGVLNFQMQFTDNRFDDPQGQKLSIDYDKGPLNVNLGDIRGSLLNTNSFASFSRSMKGAQARFKQGRTAIKVVQSEAKGSAKTVSLQGNNTAGPYYLQASQIIYDSEEVLVDGQKMKLGVDYTVNYDLGSISFTERVVPPTSTIVVTFESLGFNSSKGTIQGIGASYDTGQYGRLGITTIEQKSGGAAGLNTRTELFQGFGPASTPYFLRFTPLTTRPIFVRVNGLLQMEGADYFFDGENPAIFFFTRTIPATSEVEVTYTPQPNQTVDGDRRVTGFDYRLPLGRAGRAGYIQYSQALGSLESDVTPLSGTAKGIETRYRVGGLDFRGSVKDVPSGYVGIESRGFNRNEKSVDLGLTYSHKRLSYRFDHQNSSITTRRAAADGSIIFSPVRTTSMEAAINYTGTKSRTWQLSHTRTTSLSQLDDSRINTTRLGTNQRWGKLNTNFGLERVDGRGPIGDGFGGTKQGSVSLNTIKLDSAYQLGSAWNLSGRASVSDVRTDDRNGQGSDYSLNLGYRPVGPLNFNISYALSNAGEIATLGSLQNGYGVGYGGNGFSGGVSNSSLIGTSAADFRIFQVTGGYRLTQRMNLGARYYQAKSKGSVSSNSDSTSYGLTFDWDLGKGHLLALSMDSSETKFIGRPDAAESTAFDVYLAGSPAGPWRYRMGVTTLLSQSTSQFAQDALSFDSYVGYSLSPRQRLGLGMQLATTRGSQAQNDSYFGLFYEHQLYRNVSLISSYKIRELTTLEGISNGDYSSRGFDIELNFDFVP